MPNDGICPLLAEHEDVAGVGVGVEEAVFEDLLNDDLDGAPRDRL